MSRIKVINDVSELAAILHSCDTKVKKDVFSEISKGWVTEEEIAEKYGKEGLEAIRYFEKIKLVETQWQTTPRGPTKAYHTYYTSVQMNLTIPIIELGDVIYASTLSDKTLKEYEDKILEIIGNNKAGVFIGDLIRELSISQTLLKSIIKRSSKLDIKGHNIVVRE